MAKNHGGQIKDDKTYEALRKEGNSKEKAARIANAKARGDEPSKKGGEAPSYDEMSRDDLYKRAREVDIEGRSKLSKDGLIRALRNH